MWIGCCGEGWILNQHHQLFPWPAKDRQWLNDFNPPRLLFYHFREALAIRLTSEGYIIAILLQYKEKFILILILI